VILVDTNYLIQLLIPGTPEALRVRQWVGSGEVLCTAAVSWYEFLCGPVDSEEISLVRSLLRGGIVPLTESGAEASARLWNQVGRQRSLRVDSLIAGTALEADITLASSNLRDFTKFVPGGLTLVG